jgi:16S rRNA (cytidine1402-2'-O)-methyltransferase
VIVSEDPSATRRLLAHHGLTGEVTSYGPANLGEKVAVLLARLQEGTHIALVSDCGMPVIADPGCLLVKRARAQGIAVVSVPGPSALTATIVTSGLDCESLLFNGLLPKRTSRMKRRLADCLAHRAPSVVFCSPSSIVSALSILEKLAPHRFVMVACDVTKPTEVIVRGTARHAQRHLRRIRAAEDITLILAGKRGGRRPAHRSRSGG